MSTINELTSSIEACLSTPDSRFGPGATSSDQFTADFQPYNKIAERTFFSSDWANKSKGKNTGNVAGGFAFKTEEDMSTFSSTDTRPANKSRGMLRYYQNTQAQRIQQQLQQQRRPHVARVRNTNPRTTRPNQRKFQPYYRREEIQRGYSIVLDPKWTAIDNLPMQEIQTAFSTSITVSNLLTTGDLEAYNSSMDAARPSRPIQVTPSSAHFVNIPLADDENIAKLVENEEGCYVLTDRVASILMSSHLTTNPWDVRITVKNSHTVIDVPPESYVNQDPVEEGNIDKLTQEADNINSFQSLVKEATTLRNNVFHQMINVGTEPVAGDKPCQLKEIGGNNPSPIGYTYRKISFDDFSVIVRSHTYAHTPSQQDERLHFGSLFQFDPRWDHQQLDWKATIETQFAATLANEAKNNAAHLARIAAEATLSGASKVKLAWSTRVNSKDATRHQVLHVSTHDLTNFHQLLRLRPSGMYGALSCVIDLINGVSPGNYILLREPMDRSLTLYSTN